MEKHPYIERLNNRRLILIYIYSAVLILFVILFIGRELLLINKSVNEVTALDEQIMTQKRFHQINNEISTIVENTSSIIPEQVTVTNVPLSLEATVEALEALASELTLNSEFSTPKFTDDKEEGRLLSMNVLLKGEFVDFLEFVRRARGYSSLRKISGITLFTDMGQKSCRLVVLLDAK